MNTIVSFRFEDNAGMGSTAAFYLYDGAARTLTKEGAEYPAPGSLAPDMARLLAACELSPAEVCTVSQSRMVCPAPLLPVRYGLMSLQLTDSDGAEWNVSAASEADMLAIRQLLEDCCR